MLKNFLVALILTIAYVGLQYDFSIKLKKQKKIFVMALIIFVVVFVGCVLLLPKKKSVKFNNDVHVKSFNKTSSLTDGDGYHDEDGSGSSDDGSYDDNHGAAGVGAGAGFQNDFNHQSNSSSGPEFQTPPALTSGPPPSSLPSLTSSLPINTPSSSSSIPSSSIPFPMI